MERLRQAFLPFLDNIYVYLISSILTYLLGGLDEILLVLMILSILDAVLHLVSKESMESVFSRLVRMYIVIILSVILNKFLIMVGVNLPHAPRVYVILTYSYQEIGIINSLLKKDSTFFIPAKFSVILNKFKKR